MFLKEHYLLICDKETFSIYIQYSATEFDRLVWF